MVVVDYTLVTFVIYSLLQLIPLVILQKNVNMILYISEIQYF